MNLRESLKLPNGWVDQSKHSTVVVCKLDNIGSPVVVQSLTVLPDLSWKVYLYGKHAKNCLALKEFSSKVTSGIMLKRMILRLDTLHVCMGNPDDHFLELADSKKGKFFNASNELVAFVHDVFPVTHDGVSHKRTIRCSSCELLVIESKCHVCANYRPTLRSMHSRWYRRMISDSNERTAVSSHTNYRYLTTLECNMRMTNLKRKVDSTQRELVSLKQRLIALTKDNGVNLDEEVEREIEGIIGDESKRITDQHPPGSFQRLFWEQQSEAMKLKDRRQIRWHPMFIKWCLSLKLISSASYRSLRSSNVIVLPSDRTLRDYTHFIKAKSGFQPDLDRELLREANLDEFDNNYQRFVCLVFDEMKIKEDLVYDKHNGKLVGFMDVGDVNNELLRFEESCKNGTACSEAPKLATHMITFMVRGLLSKLDFPYASFPCLSLGGDQLYSIVWGAIRRLEACGFSVLALTCDGASCNRKFLKLHKSSSEESITYKTKNPFSVDGRPIFFISDPPHLIKTVRNCWANSHAHTNTRQLWVSILARVIANGCVLLHRLMDRI